VSSLVVATRDILPPRFPGASNKPPSEVFKDLKPVTAENLIPLIVRT